MNTLVRFGALVTVLALMAACGGTNKNASATPTIAGKQAGKGGPIVSGQAPTSSAKCVAGATNEPLWSFWAPKMTSETTGWGIGQCTLSAQPSFPNGSTLNCYAAPGDWMGILRTVDGAATWTDVSPASVPNRTWHHAQFFLDANHGWVEEVSRTADACASQATTFITSDGGATWRQGGSVTLKLSSPLDDVFNVAGPIDNMDFIDAQHGWLDVTSAPANPPGDPSQMTMLTMVYSTSDGGMHWRLMATNPGRSLLSAAGCSGFYAPVSDPMFVSDTTGWLAIGCGSGPLMLITHDGGATWSARPLPNCSCQAYIPRAFDADHVVVTGAQQSTSMLATADGGATWVQRSTPQAASANIDFIDPMHGWMVGIVQLPKSYETVVYQTVDGGQNWKLLGKPGFTVVASNSNAYFPIAAVQFISENAGFVVLGVEAGLNGQTDPTAPTLQILKTNDGGRTWTAVLKQIPAAPCSAKYSQLFGGAQNLQPVKLVSATTAWARGGLRTTDGGAHWKDVSSPAMREGAVTSLYPPSFTDFYLDGDHAWQAAVYGSKTTCSDHVTVFGTADGGVTWQQSAPITVTIPNGLAFGGIQLGFTTSSAGWMWVSIGKQSFDFGGPPTEAYLYATADGGLSWRRTAHVNAAQFRDIAPMPSDSQNCPEGIDGVTFASAQVGWLNLNCSSTAVVTKDGGATWKVQSPSFGGGLPTFVDPEHGFVQSFDPTGPNTTLFATSDGGTSWHQLGAVPWTGYIMAMSYINAEDLIALLTPPGWTKGSGGKDWVYRSSDGGQSWSLVQKDVPIGRVNGFIFSDANTGMVTQADNATCGLATTSCTGSGDTVVAVTSNGGQTWRIFKPAIDS